MPNIKQYLERTVTAEYKKGGTCHEIVQAVKNLVERDFPPQTGYAWNVSTVKDPSLSKGTVQDMIIATFQETGDEPHTCFVESIDDVSLTPIIEESIPLENLNNLTYFRYYLKDTDRNTLHEFNSHTSKCARPLRIKTNRNE